MQKRATAAGHFRSAVAALALTVMPLCALQPAHASGTAPATAPARPAGKDLTGSPGFWLLDLAWCQSAGISGQPSSTELVEILSLARAATRLDGNLAEAWLLQANLLQRLGRRREATEALQKYVELRGDDEPALMALYEARLAEAGTTEEKLKICEEILKKAGSTPVLIAFAHRNMASVFYNKLQTEQALKHALIALKVFPYDMQARHLLLQASGEDPIRAEVEFALWSLRVNPAQPDLLARVANLADKFGAYQEATFWYTKADQMLKRLGAAQRRTRLLLQMADHYLDADRPEKALPILQMVADSPEPPVESLLLLSECYRLLGKLQDATDSARKALEILKARSAAQQTSPEALASQAWGVWAARCYGWALLKAGKPVGAVNVLAPAAASGDAWSILGLAQALHKLGRKQQALQHIGNMWLASGTGAAWRAAKAWCRQVGFALPGPTVAVAKAVEDLLQKFDRRILDLPLQPEKFLKLTIQLDRAPEPSMPWFAEITVENISQMPLILGPQAAVMPDVLVRATATNILGKRFDSQALFSLYTKILLAPGQSITLRRPVDAGALRDALRRDPSEITVRFSAVLNPARDAAGKVGAGLCSVTAEPVETVRPAWKADPDALIDRALSTSAEQRSIAAGQVAAAILCFRPDAAAESTHPAAFSINALVDAFVSLLTDASPTVAARALAEAEALELSDRMLKAAAASVNNPNWLVRLLGIRLFAHKHGVKFTRHLRAFANADPDPLVRELARAYYRASVSEAAGKPRSQTLKGGR